MNGMRSQGWCVWIGLVTSLAAAGCGGGSGSEEGGAWQASAALLSPRINAVAAAPGNGHVYLFNGYVDSAACNTGRSDGRVFRAAVAADGTLGAWAEGETGPGGFNRSLGGVAVANGFIYTAGGARNGPSWDGAVWLARAATDGTLSAWTAAANPAPGWIGSAPLVAARDGVLYAGGGLNISASPNVSQALYASPLDATTGEPTGWFEASTMPTPTLNAGLVFLGGRAYLLPGGGTRLWVAPVAADHTLGAWVESTSQLPAAVSFPHLTVVSGRLVVALGGSREVVASTPQADGQPGPWSALAQLPAAASPLYQGAVVGRRLYLFGNSDCGAAAAAPASASAVYVSPPL